VANIAVIHRLSELGAQADSGTPASKVAEGLLSDSDTRVLFRQPYEETDTAIGSLGLSATEAALLPRRVKGRALWKVGGQTAVVQHQLADAGQALLHLPGHLSDPAMAWPPQVRPGIPGPVLYRTSQLVVIAAGIAAVWLPWHLLAHRRGTVDGLGVEHSARFARSSDLRVLKVRGPKPDRVVLGRSAAGRRKRLLATERRTNICVIGTTGSGKTSELCIPIILEMGQGHGSLIAATVKEDLHAHTHARRAQLGDVKVFDPFCIAVTRSATWSPLWSCATASGAQTVARALTDNNRKGGMEADDFWHDSAFGLLWAVFFVAARQQRSMADVVRRVTTHYHPIFDGHGRLVKPGELHAELCRLLAGHDATADGATGPARVPEDGPRTRTTIIDRIDEHLKGRLPAAGDDEVIAALDEVIAQAEAEDAPAVDASDHHVGDGAGRATPAASGRLAPTYPAAAPGAHPAEVTASGVAVEFDVEVAERDDDGRDARAPSLAVVPDPEVVLARDALWGVWSNEERTRASIYTTCRSFIEPWSDPNVAAASSGTCEITPEWLTDGDNTLYIVAPLVTKPGCGRCSPRWSPTWSTPAWRRRPGPKAASSSGGCCCCWTRRPTSARSASSPNGPRRAGVTASRCCRCGRTAHPPPPGRPVRPVLARPALSPTTAGSDLGPAARCGLATPRPSRPPTRRR
jgi:hypothetical protein